ncbi:MAG: dihydrodipicolinate synthase family protein, partial [Spirochaetia bacterium]|nr:dihydrodipicolinate synthase family protein [Spirochaetia bacterium]
KYVAGDLKGSLEAQLKLNPIRLATDKSSFPVATKDLANLVGQKVGKPFLPNMPSPPKQMENLKSELVKGGYEVFD